MSSSRNRLLASAAVACLVAATASACGDDSSTDRFEEAAKEAEQSTVPQSTEATEGTTGEPSETSAPDATDPPENPTPGESLLAGVDAYTDVLGPTIRALEYMQHFPVGDTSYASLQYQDQAKPQNVDQRDLRDGEVGHPEPVQLTIASDATLEENLFAMSEINWPAIAAAMPGAPALVEQKLGTTFEGSDGVTHVIVEKDLPFSANTAVRVYVDGGERAGGGYVQYFADGTLDKVQA